MPAECRRVESRAPFTRGLLIAVVLPLVFVTDVGHIQIKGPPGISVHLDGVFQGTTNTSDGGLFLMDVPEGTHELMILKDGYSPQVSRIDLARGQVYLYEVRPFTPQIRITEEGAADQVAVRSEVGTLVIQSIPVECVVTIAAIGVEAQSKRTDKMTLEMVPSGRYEARFAAMNRELRHVIRLPKDVTVELFVDFVNGVVRDSEDARIEKLIGSAQQLISRGAYHEAQVLLSECSTLRPEHELARSLQLSNAKAAFGNLQSKIHIEKFQEQAKTVWAQIERHVKSSGLAASSVAQKNEHLLAAWSLMYSTACLGCGSSGVCPKCQGERIVTCRACGNYGWVWEVCSWCSGGKGPEERYVKITSMVGNSGYDVMGCASCNQTANDDEWGKPWSEQAKRWHGEVEFKRYEQGRNSFYLAHVVTETARTGGVWEGQELDDWVALQSAVGRDGTNYFANRCSTCNGRAGDSCSECDGTGLDASCSGRGIKSDNAGRESAPTKR